jgi:hypothetical protein
LFSVGVYCLQTEWTIAQNLNTCTLDISAGEALIDKLLGNTDTIDSSNPGAGDDDDIEVIQESVKLNLKCPISLTMIKTPVKGVACRHPDVSICKQRDERSLNSLGNYSALTSTPSSS